MIKFGSKIIFSRNEVVLHSSNGSSTTLLQSHKERLYLLLQSHKERLYLLGHTTPYTISKITCIS
jgi:hypothetical protein